MLQSPSDHVVVELGVRRRRGVGAVAAVHVDVVERQLETTVAVAQVQVVLAAPAEVGPPLHLHHDESVEQERDDQGVLAREEQVRVAQHTVPEANDGSREGGGGSGGVVVLLV